MLWPGLLGQYLDELMHTGLTAADRTWLRDWSTHYVRGGALLPTLLVGAQPYGLLPVALSKPPEAPAGNVDQLLVVLSYLRFEWDMALPGVARLDPRAGDGAPGEGDRAALVSQILGAVPHPLAFALQGVDDKRGEYQFQWDFILGLVMLSCAAAGRDVGAGRRALGLGRHVGRRPDVRAVLERVGGRARRADGRDDAARSHRRAGGARRRRARALRHHRGHRAQPRRGGRHPRRRTAVAEWLQYLVPGISFRVNDGDDPKAFFDWHPSRADWALPLVDDDHARRT